MGFGDKLKELREQAQQTVAENREKLQGAVQVVGEAANTKTKGKYAGKIAQMGEKVSDKIDKVAEAAPAEADATAAPTAEEATSPAAAEGSAEPVADEPAKPATPSSPGETSSGFPDFE